MWPTWEGAACQPALHTAWKLVRLLAGRKPPASRCCCGRGGRQASSCCLAYLWWWHGTLLPTSGRPARTRTHLVHIRGCSHLLPQCLVEREATPPLPGLCVLLLWEGRRRACTCGLPAVACHPNFKCQWGRSSSAGEFWVPAVVSPTPQPFWVPRQ